MAKIPALQEGQRLNVANPTGFQSSASARLRGESISKFGRGIASVGSALTRLEKRQDAQLRRNAEMEFKSAMSRELQDINENIANTDSSGANDKELYDKQSSEAMSRLQKAFDKKYGGKYGDSFSALGNNLVTGVRSAVITNGLARKQKSIQEGILKATSRLNASARTHPDGLGENMADFESGIATSLKDSEATPREVLRAENSGKKQLADAAISGFTDRGDFSKAAEVVLTRYPELYTADGAQAKALHSINVAKQNFDNAKYKKAQRLERKQETELKKRQAKQTSQLLIQLDKAKGNLVLVEQVRQKLYAVSSAQDISTAALGGMLTGLASEVKAISSLSLYNITEAAYDADTVEDYDLLEQKVNRQLGNGGIGAKEAISAQGLIDRLRNQTKANPALRSEQKQYLDLFDGYAGSMGAIERMKEKYRPFAAKRRALGRNDIINAIKKPGQGKAAFARIVGKYFPGTQGLPLFPGMDKVPKDRTELREFYKKGRGFPAHRQSDFLEYMVSVEKALKVEELAAEKIDKIEEEEAQQTLTDFIDMDMLLQPQHNERELIWRR